MGNQRNKRQNDRRSDPMAWPGCLDALEANLAITLCFMKTTA
jgi:hypothetical protein